MINCPHWREMECATHGCCVLGAFGGRPSLGICEKVCQLGRHPQFQSAIGDRIAAVATPIARALKLPCIDPATKELRPESGCAKMKKRLNEGMGLGEAIVKRVKGV